MNGKPCSFYNQPNVASNKTNEPLQPQQHQFRANDVIISRSIPNSHSHNNMAQQAHLQQSQHTQLPYQMYQQNQNAIAAPSQLPYVQHTHQPHLQQFQQSAALPACRPQTQYPQQQQQIPLTHQQPIHDQHAHQLPQPQLHSAQHSHFNLNQPPTTHMMISQITVQLQATQAHLNSMVPRLTMLQTQLQTPSPNQNTKQLETHYKAVLGAYEQHYAQYVSYSQQIQQLQACQQQQQLHNAQQNLRLSGRIYCDNMNGVMTNEHYECDANASDSSKCISMQRLAVALKHYSTLNIMENSDDQEVFRRFMLETYHEVIDDYIHFQKYHGNELEQICDDLINIHKFVECDIERCVFTSRHYQNDRMDQTERQHMHVLDSHLNFYKDLMDTLHFHLFHCFDTGLRCKKDSGDAKQDLEAAKGCDHFDAAFARMNKAILERHHITASFARFSTKNTKYKIVMSNEKNDTMDNEDTFPDYLFKHLIAANVDTFDIVQFVSFVKDNEYDTESIEHDHGIKPSGNIATNINSKRCIQQYDQFCTDLKISASSFNIGLRFYYWPFYKYYTPEVDGINDRSGYTIINNDLYIEQKYNSFKDEIRNYKYISLEQYDKAVVKVKFYHNAQEIKKNTATRDGTLNNRYYGLDYLAKPQIKFEHLLSLVLYTDYIDLSTDFSSTFRKNNAFETLESMKRRNREYYWMSRWLRECVEMHGQSRCRMGLRYKN
eukprot:875311_1